MSYLLDCVVPYADEPDPLDSDSEYVKIKVKRPRNKLRKPSNFFLKRPKPSWSTSDLSSLYSNGSTVSPEAFDQEPRKAGDGRMYFDYRPGRPSLSGSSKGYYMLPSPPALSLEEKCLNFLEEKIIEQQQKKKVAVPQARTVYGDPDAPAITPDVSKEVHADYSVCAMSEEEAAACKAQRRKWDVDKARGVHFPSLLNVRRKELAVALQAAHKVNVKFIPKPPRPLRTLSTEMCKNCAVPGTVIPPGLNPSDWLPLVYLRRAQRCERQRPIPEEAEKARAIVVNRMIQENVPRPSVWTCRRHMRSRPGPSPLSKSTMPTAVSASTESASIDETESSSLSDGGIDVEAQSLTADTDSFLDSSSEYSDDQTDLTSEHSEPISAAYQAVEVRGLQWMKKYRVPKFLPASKEHPRSSIDEKVPENGTVAEPARLSPLSKWNCDKPLPPLPTSTPPHFPPQRNPTHPRGLRRSHSVHVGVLGRQYSMQSRAQVQPL